MQQLWIVSVQNGPPLRVDSDLHWLQESEVFLPVLLLHVDRSVPVLVFYYSSNRLEDCASVSNRLAWSVDTLGLYCIFCLPCGHNDYYPLGLTHSDDLHQLSNSRWNEDSQMLSASVLQHQIEPKQPQSFRSWGDPKRQICVRAVMVAVVVPNSQIDLE